MQRFRFTYTTLVGSIRSNIIIEAPNREAAIAAFKTDYPELTWKITTTLTKQLF